MVTLAEKEPSPKKRRKKLGNRNATIKISVWLRSKKVAITKSRKNPDKREIKVPRDIRNAQKPTLKF